MSPPKKQQEPADTTQPITWHVGDHDMTYDPKHPESSDIHPINTTHGRQFLLFQLSADDFRDPVAYKRMKQIADHPVEAKRQGDQGVIFLRNEKTVPMKDKDGNKITPSVKLKMLGNSGHGDIRAFGYAVKTAANETLNIVTCLDEEAHKMYKRNKHK